MSHSTQNTKGMIALQEYQEKVRNGEIERTPQKNPREKWELDKTSLRKSVNAQCFQCMGGCKGDNAIKEIKECSSYDCSLWHVRPYK